MERPRVLLAAHDDAAAIAAALTRAGFEVIGSEEAFEAALVEGHKPEMAVIDADLAPGIVRRVHASTERGRAGPGPDPAR